MTRTVRIREVWASNLEEEMRNISYLLDDYDHVAIDTEFPGVVARPIGAGSTDMQYQTLRCNVDLLKIIQLGISLANEDGDYPDECTTWQFNFSFSLAHDMYAQDSIELLTSSGIDFAAHERKGIDVLSFGEWLTSSGLVLNNAVKWISFHGGYDFGYLIKILTAIALPSSETDFFELLDLFFPHRYDLKVLMRSSDRLFGGLNKLAGQLGCERVGTMHQAGSDSLLTLDVFYRMRDEVFDGTIDESKKATLFGLGAGAAKSLAYSPEKARRSPLQRPGNGSAADPAPPAALTAS